MMGGDFSLIGTLLMMGCAALCFWGGRKASNAWHARKHRQAVEAARATESRQVRRARERRESD